MRMVVGVHRLHCYPNQWKISGHHLRAATGNSEYCTMVASYQLSINPQNMVLVTIHQENRFKGPTETEPHWTHTAADYQGQIPWTYSGQGVEALDPHYGDQTSTDPWLHGLWPSVRYEVSNDELRKLKKLACLATTGAIKTTSTPSMEVFLLFM